MSRTYRNSGTYRSANVYRGVTSQIGRYVIDLPTRKNVAMRSATTTPTEKAVTTLVGAPRP